MHGSAAPLLSGGFPFPPATLHFLKTFQRRAISEHLFGYAASLCVIGGVSTAPKSNTFSCKLVRGYRHLDSQVVRCYDTPPRGGDKDAKAEPVQNRLAVVSLCFGSIAGDGGAAGGSPSRS